MTQATLERLSRDELPEEFAPAWDMLNRLTGEPAFVEAFATAPHVLNFVMGDFYQKLFFGGQVDQRYKQLARLRLSALHGCQTCNKQNTVGAAEAGFSPEQVTAIMGDYAAGGFDGADLAVLRYADQVALTNAGGKLDDTLTAELQAHFSSADICELGTVMAVISGMAKLAFVMDLVDKEPYCVFA
ncbi:MAG: carboxymuconolactone decarboxylase family protein [Gammaproteobacteria bacterium]